MMQGVIGALDAGLRCFTTFGGTYCGDLDFDDSAPAELHCRSVSNCDGDSRPRAFVTDRREGWAEWSLWKGGYVDVELGSDISCDRAGCRITGA